MKRRLDKSRFRNDLSFLDMLFNMAMAFAFLFIIALMLIKPATPVMPSTSVIKPKAEFMITMTWPDGSLDDIDLWLQLPDGQRVYFRNKDIEHATLERDDLGGTNDMYGPIEHRQLLRLNKELITLRAIVPGRYVIAAHVFDTHDEVEGYKTEQRLPYPISFELLKINPQATVISTVRENFAQHNDKKSVLAFTINDDGSVSGLEEHPIDVVVE